MFNKLKNLSKGQMITGGIAAAGIIADIINGTDGGLLNSSKTTEYLWKFVEHDSRYSSKELEETARKYGYGPAPDLVGAGQSSTPGRSSGKNGLNQSIEHINVVDNFMWTQSPKSSREDVPVMMLREKRIQINPQLNQIANNLFVATEKAARGASSLKQMMPQELMDKIKNNKIVAESELGGAMIDVGTAGADAAKYAASSKGAGVLGPYEQLYYTKDTGFVYSLPYMERQFKSTSNSFGDSSGTGVKDMLMQMGVKGTQALSEISQGFNIADPGTYVEQPKLYNFGGRETKSYTMSFPLINTNSFNDVIRNWQFIFLMIYQNTPNRLTRDLIDPPCIYEANLDGTWYSKYAYIRSISVDFVGATRRMSLPIPTEVTSDGTGDKNRGSFEVQTIIPDVYTVNLTVEEIFPETQNFIYHSVNQQNRQVTTNSLSQGLELPTSIKDLQANIGKKAKGAIRGALGSFG